MPASVHSWVPCAWRLALGNLGHCHISFTGFSLGSGHVVPLMVSMVLQVDNNSFCHLQYNRVQCSMVPSLFKNATPPWTNWNLFIIYNSQKPQEINSDPFPPLGISPSAVGPAFPWKDEVSNDELIPVVPCTRSADRTSSSSSSPLSSSSLSSTSLLL